MIRFAAELLPFATVPHSPGRALSFAFGMFWDILCALILGFFPPGGRAHERDAPGSSRWPLRSCGDSCKRAVPMLRAMNAPAEASAAHQH